MTMAGDNIDIEKLAAYTLDSVDTEEEFHFIRFESLQRLNIAYLEIILTRMKSKLLRGSGTSQDLEQLRLKLQQYSKFDQPGKSQTCLSFYEIMVKKA